MKLPSNLNLVALTVLISLAATPARAQAWYDNYFGAIYQSYNIMSPETRRQMREATDRARAGGAGQINAGGNAWAPFAPQAPLSPSASPQRVESLAQTIALTGFKPVEEERKNALDSAVAGMPAGPGRDKMRAMIEQLSFTVENSAGPYKNNLAWATYTLLAVSILYTSGSPFDQTQQQEVIRAINAAYSKDHAIARLNDRERSKMYYTCVSLTALESGMVLSNDPQQIAAGKAIAKSTLQIMGVKP